jgi:hypothetical protein
MTANEIAVFVGTDRLPHNQFQQATVQRIRGVGFDVVEYGDYPGHALIDFGREPTSEDWDAVEGVFEPAQENPVRRRR